MWRRKRGGEGMTDVLLSEKPGVNCDSGQLLCIWFLPLGRLVVEFHLFESRYMLPPPYINSSDSTGVAWQNEWKTANSIYPSTQLNKFSAAVIPRERRREKNETAKCEFQFFPPSTEPDTIARGYAWAAHTLLCLQVLFSWISLVILEFSLHLIPCSSSLDPVLNMMSWLMGGRGHGQHQIDWHLSITVC